eukprot:GSMAST32.ASY1.ANO1.658.1 assembled CDS
MAFRLSADLIENSRTFYNCIGERELDLRGQKILVIENMGIIDDQFCAIDFCENDIQKLGNFPRMKRLRSLYISNNNISKIDLTIGDSLLGLESLQLSNNKLANLGDLAALASLRKLRELNLLNNPVVRRPDYRLFVVHCIPQVTLLDFRKVTRKERLAAAALFSTEEGEKILDVVSSPKEKDKNTFTPMSFKNGPTPQQLQALQDAIQNAKTPAEVDRLEQMVRLGEFPSPEKDHTTNSVNGGNKNTDNTDNTETSSTTQAEGSTGNKRKLSAESNAEDQVLVKKTKTSPKKRSPRRSPKTSPKKSSPRRSARSSPKKAKSSPKKTLSKASSPRRSPRSSPKKTNSSPKQSLRSSPRKTKSSANVSVSARKKELMKLKSKELKDLCLEANLDNVGTKAVLCKRIIQYERS